MSDLIAILNASGKFFVDVAVPMLVQSSILIVALLVLNLLLRRRVKAVIRYWIWLLVLIKLMLPSSFTSPTSLAYWIGARLPSWSQEIQTALPETPAIEFFAGSTEQPHLARAPQKAQPLEYAAPAPGSTASPPVEAHTPVAAVPVVPLAPDLAWQAMTFLAWLAVVAAMTLLLIQRAFFVRGLVLQSERPPQRMRDLLESCRKQMGVRAPVQLRLTSMAASPSVAGLTRPKILMPQPMLAALDDGQLNSILLHELAHVKRGDLWISLLQTLLQILYFFHPLLWLANLMIRRVREQAVDETVLAAMGDEAEDYPRTLLNISRLAFGRPALSLRLLGVVESKRALTARIKHIASRPFPQTAKLGLAGLVLIAAVAAILLPMARAEDNSDKKPPQPQAASPSRSAESPPTRTIHGVVTDTLGRPRECVYVTPQGQRISAGTMSDAQGRFTLENVTPDQKIWIAYSQASQLNGIFRLPRKTPAQPFRVTLDLGEADVTGRVVGADGKALPNRKVELVVTAANGIRFPMDYRPTTDDSGYYTHGAVPCGKGVTVEATLIGANDAPTAYSTGPVKVRGGQTLIEMPVLVAAAKKNQPQFNANLHNDGMLHCRGRIVDEDGKPIAGVRVKLSFDMPERMCMWVRDAVTDNRGRWHRAIPPQCMNLSLDFEHPEHYWEGRRDGLPYKPARNELEEGTHRVAMKRGLILEGKVVDAQGRPVENALVCARPSYPTTPGPYSQIIEDSTADRTRADGAFRIKGLPPGKRGVTAYSNDHAPTVETVDIQGQVTNIEMVVRGGRTYRGRLANARGEPIEGARIGIWQWRLGKRSRSFSRIAYSDAQGRFALTNLPEGQIELSVAKKPYMGFHRDLPEDLAEVDEMVMYESPVFTGRVVDADTNEPVTKFRIANGIKWKREDASFSWSRRDGGDVENANGQFTHRWDGYGLSYPFSSVAGIRIAAPGYVPTGSPPLELDQTPQPLTIRLRRGVRLAGTVLQPDGIPASKAQVGFVELGRMAFVDRDHFSMTPYVYQTEIIENSDETGRFEFPCTEGQGLIVALHESGYAQVPSAELTGDAAIRLTAWSRLEGTIDHARIEEENVEVTLSALEQGSRDKLGIYWTFDPIAPTGATFAYEFLPAVPLAIGRDCRYERDNATFLQPEPGQTYTVAIGAPGRTVTGRIVCPSQVLKNKSIELNDPRQTHAVAFRIGKADDVPARIGTIAERSFIWLWRDKERVYAPSQTVKKRFIPRIAADGRFAFPSLAPGEYEFVVNLHAPLGKNVSCGRGVLEAVAAARFTVPKNRSNPPLSVPDVALQLLTYPGVGEPAPRFEAKTFDGKAIRLEDLRGKVVLLDFWATWCSPCVAELPKMQTLHETFANREDFAMIGLSLDQDAESARKLIDQKHLAWPQVCLGSMDESPVVKQYGIGGIPMTILIDADGTILARGADAKALKQLIADALREKR